MKIMAKLCEVIYGVAMLLIFGTALCADGLADIPHGFLIMFICVGVAGGLVLLGNWLEARISLVEKIAARRGGALTGGRSSASAEKPHSHYRETERKMSR